MVTRVLLHVLEVVFVLTVLAGVAMVFVPLALVLGGVLGVVAVERTQADLRARAKAKEAGGS